MTLYLVHGNKNLDKWGYESYVFGIYTEKDSAESAKYLIAQELYEIAMNEDDSYIRDISDVDIDIKEIKADEGVDIYLGGYCE